MKRTNLFFLLVSFSIIAMLSVRAEADEGEETGCVVEYPDFYSEIMSVHLVHPVVINEYGDWVYRDFHGDPFFNVEDGEIVLDDYGNERFIHEGVYLKNVFLENYEGEYFYIDGDGYLEYYDVNALFKSSGAIVNAAPGHTSARDFSMCGERKGELYAAIVNSIILDYLDEQGIDHTYCMDYMSRCILRNYDEEDDNKEFWYVFAVNTDTDLGEDFYVELEGDAYDCTVKIDSTDSDIELAIKMLSCFAPEENIRHAIDLDRDCEIAGYDSTIINVSAGGLSGIDDLGSTGFPARFETSTYDIVSVETSQETIADAAGLETSLSEITPSDYLSDATEYITLGDLSKLSATQTIYKITDDLVQDQIDEELYMYAEETEKDIATVGDIVYADIVSSINGNNESETSESTYLVIGDQDYGAEFDEQLIGARVGDEFDFSASYDEEAWYEEWIEQTVSFKVTVTGVYEYSLPQYDDEFVREHTDYSSKEEYEAAIRAELVDRYNEISYQETTDALLQSAIDLSTYKGYPEDLYSSCKEELISFYGQFLENDNESAILEQSEITQEDLEEDILYSVKEQLLISAIYCENNLEMTQQEYDDMVRKIASEYGYESTAEYIELEGRDLVTQELYKEKVKAFLYDIADITTVEKAVTE